MGTEVAKTINAKKRPVKEDSLVELTPTEITLLKPECDKCGSCCYVFAIRHHIRERDWILRCPHLDEDTGLCKDYEDRPEECRYVWCRSKVDEATRKYEERNK